MSADTPLCQHTSRLVSLGTKESWGQHLRCVLVIIIEHGVILKFLNLCKNRAGKKSLLMSCVAPRSKWNPTYMRKCLEVHCNRIMSSPCRSWLVIINHLYLYLDRSICDSIQLNLRWRGSTWYDVTLECCGIIITSSQNHGTIWPNGSHNVIPEWET